jgi:hypothetical protein
MVTVRFAAFACLAVALMAPPVARAVDTIPFTEVKGGLIQVQGSVDGQTPVPMLIDTGAGVDVLSTALGRKLVLVKGKYVSLRLTGQRVDLPVGTIVSLAVGGVNVDAPHVGIWNGLDGTGIDGLVSATAFRNIATTFDFRNRQVIIEDAQTFPERVRAGIKVPIVLQDDLGISLGLFARFDFGGGKVGLCEIDTGSPGITIDRGLAASLGMNPNVGTTKDDDRAADRNIRQPHLRLQHRQLVLGGENLHARSAQPPVLRRRAVLELPWLEGRGGRV